MLWGNYEALIDAMCANDSLTDIILTDDDIYNLE